MLDKLSHYLQNFPFANFTNPILYLKWATALVEIFAFLLICLSISNLIINTKNVYFRSELEEFVIRSALGISMVSFSLSFLALVGGLKPILFCMVIITAIFLSLLRDRAHPLHTIHIVRAVFSKYKYLWVLFLVSSLPSLLPPLTYDATFYHLPYVLKWVNAGKLLIDPSMRYPLYTFNYHMLFSVGFFLNSTDFIHLTTWLCGVLCCLTIISMLHRFNTWTPLNIIAGVSFFFTPVVQQHLNIAYLDVPLMFFTLITTYSLLLLTDNPRNYPFLLSAAIVSAMFVGIKPTGALYVPLIFFIVLYKEPLKNNLHFLVVFSILGSLWYFRNFIIDGDPIPPALNILLGEQDLYWSPQDFRYIMSDLRIYHDWGRDIWFRLPLELISSTGKGPLRYWPLLGYILIFPLSVPHLLWSRRNRQEMVILSFTIYSILIWLMTSYFTRYAHYIPLAIVCSTIMLNDTVKIRQLWTKKVVRYAMLGLFVFLMIGPKTSALDYFIKNFGKKIPLTNDDIVASIGNWGGDPELINLIWNLKRYGLKRGERIYCYMLRQSEYKYYFEKEGFSILSDVVGHFRIGDFDSALKNGTICKFLKNAGVQYVLMDRKGQENVKKFLGKDYLGKGIVHRGIQYLLMSL